MKTENNWTTATQNLGTALAALANCLDSGRNAWLEVQKNGEQDYPIMEVNPALDDPFNWTMSYGIPRPNGPLKANFLNDVERDLTENWCAKFATPEARELYKETGEVTADLLKGNGVCTPVRRKDADTWRAKTDGYKEGAWITIWKPVVGVSYRTPAPVGDVFVVCFNSEPMDKKEAFKNAALFLTKVAEQM